MHAYFAHCQELFDRFKSGREMLPGSEAGPLSLDHCPEPYLSCGETTDPFCVVTGTPAAGGSIHRLNTILDGGQTPIRADRSYDDNAASLADFYLGDLKNDASIRMFKQIELTEAVQASGMLELRCIPFHPAEALDEVAAMKLIESSAQIRAYNHHLEKFVAEHHALALASVPAGQEISDETLELPWVQHLAELIGFQSDRVVSIPLTVGEKWQSPSMLFLSTVGRVLKGLCCVAGEEDLPSSDAMARLKNAFEHPPGRLTDPSGRVLRLMVQGQEAPADS